MTTPEFHLRTDLTPSFPVPGFRFAGTRCGIKHARPDLALLVSDRPAVAAGCFTQNRVRAACVDRNEGLLPSDGVRAVLINSGNANAMTGQLGHSSNTRMAEVAATALGLETDAVLTGSTGIIGVPLPLQLIEEASGGLEAQLRDDPEAFAKAILTTDTCTKVAHTSVQLPGHDAPIRLLGIAKGSGMIHPNMATTFGFVVTDAAIAPATLQAQLRIAVDRTFNAITVDGDSSTNDMVLAFANGASGQHVEGDAEAAFATALEAVLRALAKQVAADGEGSTRLLEVEVTGAPTEDIARALARGVCRSNLVKCSAFAGQPEWGRVSMALGQVATDLDLDLDPAQLRISAQGTLLYDNTGPKLGHNASALRSGLQQTEVRWSIDVGMGGPGSSTAYGCDLSYDYVRINADESKQIEVSRTGGVSRNLSLAAYSPRLKHQLLCEGLSYVRRFTGMRAMIYLPDLEKLDPLVSSLAGDLELCLDAGIRPVAVLPNARAVETITEHMRRVGRFADGVTADVVSISNLLDRGHLCLLSRNAPTPDTIVDMALKLGIQKLIVLGPDGGLRDKHGLVQRLSPDTFLTGHDRGRFDATNPELLVLARHAAKRGVPAFHAIDARIPHAVVGELFTDEGIGTLMTRQALG